MRGRLLLACAQAVSAAAGCTENMNGPAESPGAVLGWLRSAPLEQPLAASGSEELRSPTVRSMVGGTTAHIALQPQAARTAFAKPWYG